MNVKIEFVYRPNWTHYANGLGFGPSGLIASTFVDVAEIDREKAPARYRVRDGDERIHVLHEHSGSYYEPMPKMPQGLGLAALSEMDFRPRKAWDGSWEMAFDKELPLARFETKRLECLQRGPGRNPTGVNHFLVASGDHREAERAAKDVFGEAGVVLIGGQICRKVPAPVLVLTSHPKGHKTLSVSMRPVQASASQKAMPIEEYEAAAEAVRASGGQVSARPLVVDLWETAPSPGPR